MSAPINNIIPSANAATFAAVITASDTERIKATRALWVGSAGDVKVDMVGDGQSVVLSGVQVGTLLPIVVTRVYATGTTATNLVALY
ncbi:hypothetical protein [Acidovorax sp.]|jgi:hypothetical protein|uniref:spike base protein, RCAP_Rcc01079 family n=1 Tax=Acidovorax sp. TaxID=1872122 RepID=UPI002623E451|nr:hypothetical protein [Acidovorax sp.]HQS65375.1 hypothetical protein [Acidovorax defluvii]HQT19404.1 hypothetical protein [Acidovorax defluvii]HQT51138.1 hypothetical protein [Acidovorax defluvii]